MVTAESLASPSPLERPQLASPFGSTETLVLVDEKSEKMASNSEKESKLLESPSLDVAAVDRPAVAVRSPLPVLPQLKSPISDSKTPACNETNESQPLIIVEDVARLAISNPAPKSAISAPTGNIESDEIHTNSTVKSSDVKDAKHRLSTPGTNEILSRLSRKAEQVAEQAAASIITASPLPAEISEMITSAVHDATAHIRSDIRNMHVDLLRQFEFQKLELQDLMERYSPTDAFMDELESLRQENQRLRLMDF